MTRRILILGAAGRDFHNFNVLFREDPGARVEAFTACQIPGIAGRRYPAALAGPLYPEGVPIFDETELAALVARFAVDEAVFAYSDVSYEEVMGRAAIANAAGADFRLVAPRATMLRAGKPVVAVCAVRTGAGKSQVARRAAAILRDRGLRVAVVRHPMPYDADLAFQRAERFASLEDLARFRCTIEEREEYEPHLRAGHVVFAGVDYAEILRMAEAEADVLLWDGGNNDLPFFRPDLHIVLVDPHRPGHELRYFPGETNLRMADVVIVNKAGSADPAALAAVEANVRRANPRARTFRADSVVTADDPEAIRGRRALVVEDGPTVTHGGMAYGAGRVAAERCGARAIVDPRPYAVGTLRETFARHPHLRDVLPAMGYGEGQVRELEATIAAVPCDVVVVGTPIDLASLVKSPHPMVRVRYGMDEAGAAELAAVLDDFLARRT